ncbi:hypothetical protein F-VV10_0381 [Faustovirus]|nr:hypothetical protein F-VV10_0381 [Faustovirus]
MEAINKILEYNKQKLSKILTGLAEYYKNIEKVVELNNSKTNDKFTSIVSSAGKTLDKMKTSDTTLESIATFYDSFDALIVDIDYLISVINDPYYTKMHVINMSQTFIDNIHKRKSMLLDEYEEFKEKTVDNNETVYKIMFRGFDYTKNKTEVNKLLLKYKNNVNKFIIALVNHIYSSDDPMLQTYIEGMKNLTLGGDELGSQRYLDNKSVGYINYILGRNNLAPITESMPIGALLGRILGKHAGISDGAMGVEAAVQLIKSAGLKHDVYIIIKHVLTPLEFDIRPLVDKQYLINNGIYLPIDNMLSDAMLKKTNTNYMLKGSGEKCEQKIIHINANSSKCYIIESLVPNLYRLMSNLMASSDAEWGLSNHLETNLDGGSVIRPMLYNDIINAEILDKKGFKNHTALVNKFKNEYKATSLPADTVMTKVKEELRNQIEKLIESDKHKSDNDFIASATDTAIIAAAINKVLPMKEAEGGSRAEYTITYLIRINDIAFEFTKKFSSALVDKGVRKFYANKNTLRQICFEAIDMVVAIMYKAGKWNDFEYSFKEFVLDNEFVIM